MLWECSHRREITCNHCKRVPLLLSSAVEYTHPQRSVSSVTEIIGHDREDAPFRPERDSFVSLRAEKFILLTLSDELQEAQEEYREEKIKITIVYDPDLFTLISG